MTKLPWIDLHASSSSLISSDEEARQLRKQMSVSTTCVIELRVCWMYWIERVIGACLPCFWRRRFLGLKATIFTCHLTFSYEQSLNSIRISLICRPDTRFGRIRSLLIVKTVWNPIFMKESTALLDADSQPVEAFPLIVFMHTFDKPFLEDSSKHVPPYFWDATLNGLQVVDTGNKLKKKTGK